MWHEMDTSSECGREKRGGYRRIRNMRAMDDRIERDKYTHTHTHSHFLAFLWGREKASSHTS